jgi:hypothetical protein
LKKKKRKKNLQNTALSSLIPQKREIVRLGTKCMHAVAKKTHLRLTPENEGFIICLASKIAGPSFELTKWKNHEYL